MKTGELAKSMGDGIKMDYRTEVRTLEISIFIRRWKIYRKLQSITVHIGSVLWTAESNLFHIHKGGLHCRVDVPSRQTSSETDPSLRQYLSLSLSLSIFNEEWFANGKLKFCEVSRQKKWRLESCARKTGRVLGWALLDFHLKKSPTSRLLIHNDGFVRSELLRIHVRSRNCRGARKKNWWSLRFCFLTWRRWPLVRMVAFPLSVL